jgi:hypothetical protein
MEARGVHQNSLDFETGKPSDWIDAAKLPAPMPWNVFVDDKLTVARPLNGAEPLHMVRKHVYGHDAVLYEGTARIHAGKVIHAYSNAGNTPGANGAVRLRDTTKPPVHRAGPRGESIMSPYTTWHGHTRVDENGLHASEHIPMWIGITLHGVITYAMRDGSSRDAFQIPLAADSWTNDFTFFEPDRKLFFVAETPKGRVLKIDRNTTPWTVSVLADGLGQVDSVRAVGDQLYTADSVAGEVWGIDAATGAKRRVAVLNQAFWISHFSDGKLCVMTKRRTVHEVDPVTGLVGLNNLLASVVASTSGQPWVMVDVDRNGTCGKKDALIAISVTGAANVDCYRVLRDGTPAMPEHGKGIASVGAVMHVIDPFGHYPWVIAHHPNDGCFMVQGMESIAPQVVCSVHPDDYWTKASAPWMPARNDAWLAAWDAGRKATRDGGGASYPSFTAQINTSGGGIISADHIAELPFEEQCQFWLRGGIGSVPRVLTKAQLTGLVLFQARNSMRYAREGARFLDPLKAFLDARV